VGLTVLVRFGLITTLSCLVPRNRASSSDLGGPAHYVSQREESHGATSSSAMARDSSEQFQQV